MNDQNPSKHLTRAVMSRYFESEHSDVSDMAEDVVFTVMATGEEHCGPEAVLDMLYDFYRLAFTARSRRSLRSPSSTRATRRGRDLRRAAHVRLHDDRPNGQGRARAAVRGLRRAGREDRRGPDLLRGAGAAGVTAAQGGYRSVVTLS